MKEYNSTSVVICKLVGIISGILALFLFLVYLGEPFPVSLLESTGILSSESVKIIHPVFCVALSIWSFKRAKYFKNKITKN